MREVPPPSPAVVVGIDGSRTAIDAALWAVDEAADRDLPLRLVAAIEPRKAHDFDCRTASRDFAIAESAVRQAVMAVESLDKPVKVEVEIAQGDPTTILLSASRSAAVICLGALGVNRAIDKRMGSTAAEVAARAHCPVAVVRRPPIGRRGLGRVVAEFDNSPDAPFVVELAVHEALLRNCALRVVTTGITRTTADTACTATAGPDRALQRSRRLHPELDIRVEAATGAALDYIDRHADVVDLLVISPFRSGHLRQPIGAPRYSALHEAKCSVLIAERHRAL